jgi:hypothetical protein
MPRSRRAAVGAALCLAATATGGCTAVEQPEHEPYPAVAVVDGPDEDDPKTLTLTPDAVRRLELATEVVDDPAAVPFAAVLYDKKGAPWVYTATGERTFLRVPVAIEQVKGSTAVLTAGPPRGTRVVTRAAIKLYGAEMGVGGGH